MVRCRQRLNKTKTMDDQKQQLIDKLQSATNILVTVSSSPSVDQLAASIALTVALNKMKKHATAVFSGAIPETIEFLKPEETLEKNTDSLRDFIIALDKTKADKLRYKVEDKVVKIFITPYRTSITSDDLNFSQGDFNVDAVVALGVQQQQDLDEAITAHGRILHDATVMGIHNKPGGELGSINWVNTTASSLSELVAGLVKQLDKKLTDEQIATALLTGIVAETDRFRNENTTAQTMSVSAELMAAGANQQLVTSELEHGVNVQETPRDSRDSPDNFDPSNTFAPGPRPKKAKAKNNNGTLEINHKNEDDTPKSDATEFNTEKFDTHEPETQLPQVAGQEQAQPSTVDTQPQSAPNQANDDHRDVMTEAPRFDSPMTSNDKPQAEKFEPSVELSKPNADDSNLLTHNQPSSQQTDAFAASPFAPSSTPEPSAPTVNPAPQDQTWSAEPTTDVPPPSSNEPLPSLDVDAARAEVMKALSEQPNETLPPIAALNAQPMGGEFHPSAPTPPVPQQPAAAYTPQPLAPNVPDLPPASHSPADQPMDMQLPPSGGLQFGPPQTSSPTDANNSAAAPPPVPPPMTPPSWPAP